MKLSLKNEKKCLQDEMHLNVSTYAVVGVLNAHHARKKVFMVDGLWLGSS